MVTLRRACPGHGRHAALSSVAAAWRAAVLRFGAAEFRLLPLSITPFGTVSPPTTRGTRTARAHGSPHEGEFISRGAGRILSRFAATSNDDGNGGHGSGARDPRCHVDESRRTLRRATRARGRPRMARRDCQYPHRFAHLGKGPRREQGMGAVVV